MAHTKVWLVTGASRGLGVEIAKAALAAGHAVVATGRDPAKVTAAIGEHDNLSSITLDVTNAEHAKTAVAAAIDKFGRLDVIVNNAGNFHGGFFEELTDAQIQDQADTVLFGPMRVTRAALPTMRKQRSGLVITISSTAGFVGESFCTAYAAAKFGVEGWMESLAPEIAPFGIQTMLVEPGFFRTEFLGVGSTTYAEPGIPDYAERAGATISALTGLDGKQPGDPAKLAEAIVSLAELGQPPARFVAGTDAMKAFEAKANAILAQVNAHRELSSALSFGD